MLRSTLIETVKSEGTGSTNYGISDNGASGGTVTMVTAPASGTTLVLLRNTALTQETGYVANDPFPAETHEDALDKLNMQTQELQEELDRSLAMLTDIDVSPAISIFCVEDSVLFGRVIYPHIICI